MGCGAEGDEEIVVLLEECEEAITAQSILERDLGSKNKPGDLF
jgi:hypothetical protein